MTDIVLHLVCVGLAIYVAGAGIIVYGLTRAHSDRKPGFFRNDAFISLIIAARNESATIARCLLSIKAQRYPTERFEVIVTDDRSDDGTGDIVRRFTAEIPSLKLVRIDSVPLGVSPKKHALMKAIKVSRGDILLQTDADCEVPPDWIEMMTRPLCNGVGIVAGLSPYYEAPGALNSFIRHEYLWNAALMVGTIALGMGTHATGRNLAFLRCAFDDAGGYGSTSTVLSGDDTLLLHRIQSLTRYRPAIMPDKPSHVMTVSSETFSLFFHQRIRHMSTGKRFSFPAFITGVLVYGFHITLLAGVLLSLLDYSLLPWIATVLSAKLLIDAFAAMTVETTTGLRVQWRRFPINELLLIVYMAVFPVLGAFFQVKWKENS